MKKHFVMVGACLLSVALSAPAYAAWAIDGGIGLRQVRMTEVDRNGRTLVKEHGVLPGVELKTVYSAQPWRIALSGDAYASSLTYDGQVQTGSAFSTETATTQLRLGLEGAYSLTATTFLIAGIEHDYWRRHILGRGSVRGLTEQYTSWRLLAGGQVRILQSSWADVELKSLVVASLPERLKVQFENHLFDNATLDTKSAVGGRLALSLLLRQYPGITVATDVEWMRINRSDNAVLFKQGSPVGFLSQPEHLRKAIGIKLSYRF